MKSVLMLSYVCLLGFIWCSSSAPVVPLSMSELQAVSGGEPIPPPVCYKDAILSCDGPPPANPCSSLANHPCQSMDGGQTWQCPPGTYGDDRQRTTQYWSTVETDGQSGNKGRNFIEILYCFENRYCNSCTIVEWEPPRYACKSTGGSEPVWYGYNGRSTYYVDPQSPTCP